jgi:hypothetical protein
MEGLGEKQKKFLKKSAWKFRLLAGKLLRWVREKIDF